MAILAASFAALPSVTKPAVLVTARRVVAVMAAVWVWVIFPAAVSVTVLPAMPGAATSKPFLSV